MIELITDIAILGAGPAGAAAAALLIKRGYKVLVMERETFPRFSIGESMLPQVMGLLEEAQLLRGVVEEGFQFKNGAAFVRGDRSTVFDFRQKFSPGWATTYQVQRGTFDKILIDQAQAMGADVRYQHEVLSFTPDPVQPSLTGRAPEGEFSVKARFVFDATGFGRLLPRLLNMESPSGFPVRWAFFTHIQDGIVPGEMDRNKILVHVHPERQDIWYWLIPFSNGRCSLGVVGEPELMQHTQGSELERLKQMVSEVPGLSKLLRNAVWDTPGRNLKGYSANVNSLHGPGFALLGNAGEFLDPVFSSGVTIALKSASMAAPMADAQLKGQKVDWDGGYEKPLRRGVNAFRAFVESWYRGGFQNIIFYERQQPEIRRMICAILAGYAWDTKNPYVAEPARLAALEAICAPA